MTGDESDCVVVANPVSGGPDDDISEIRELAAEYGFGLAVSEESGDAIELTHEAIEAGAIRVGAYGGDGTINEVVRGIDAANAFESTTLGVLPGGTGNNFAGNIGVESVEHGFSLLAEGETRRIDLGVAGDELFVNSCVCGLTADASEATSSELKGRFGELAYVFNTIDRMRNFESIPLHVHAEDEEVLWDGDAMFVLIGNARRFPAGGRQQANVEDGLFEVTIIEDVSTGQLVRETATRRLLGGEVSSIHRLTAPSLTVDVRREEPVSFSFDGEIDQFNRLPCQVRPRTLAVRVGEGYDPVPPEPEDV
ncbi:diacylglycerol/lipid kinase family protein [Halalkalicoccus jeotgali]|uniref:Diacylglycerol kinase catalytic region n=1 Tax=Halalkalicoccus jeotgali (strain DSM 18796 / CECT 7217 / JCM 14584 / KCTC 4019 / B3) TaxID=795797 RepID=D8JAC6_HALJB|nr:diacylglycerol kinase family protein [Halalkalicoccus jeotgali]ADJ14648.1 diacylglycerol kinase catalytic region [Halalkalicoccus jeotgali B3]ELY39546.1 diacylglycerol kinase catalytic subunit [Halalkalicoccus jeotgali B3]